MTTEFVTNYINSKVKGDEDFIRCTFYEMRIKNNLSVEEVDDFLRVARSYFENKNYNVYFTGAKYTYKGTERVVESNELMIAIKDQK